MLQLRSTREIQLMRKAGLVVWEAHQAAARLIQPGMTTAEIDAAVEAVFVRHRAVPLFKGVPGKVPFPAATCVSVNEEVVHGIPGPRILRNGDIVSVDTGCQVEGWCGDSAYTHPAGSISAEKQRLLDVTRGTLALALRLLGEKSRWSEIAAEMERFVRAAGFSVVEKLTGHGVGRTMHELPEVPNFFSRELLKNDFVIRPGLVIAVEPMVNVGTKEVRCLSDHWTLVTTDGKPSAHFEHTIAVTSNGPIALTGPPDETFPPRDVRSSGP